MAEPPIPDAPYPGLMRRLAEQIERDVAAAEPLRSQHEGAPAAVRERISTAVDRLSGDLVALAHDIHDHPELGYAEHHAADAVARVLRAHGHDAEVGAYGLSTAVRARAGDPRPRVAVLGEYDALPELGHACGHNIIAATAVGAFLAVAEVVGEVDGSVELIGTPAEEGGGGKERIARAGGFEEVDAAVMLHPAGWDLAEHPWIGVRTVDLVYRGRAAHASMTPFLGRNALDAVVQAYTGISQLRQHMLPTDRVHGIITDGGQKPNIVPERAAATFYLRSAEPETFRELCERAEAIFRAAAAATGTTVAVRWDPTPLYLPVRNNRPLAARYAANLADRRRVLPAGIVPREFNASTDLGNVSVRVPAIHPTLAIAPPTVMIHQAEFAEWAGSERADRGTVDGALGLALTAADYLCDAALRDAVHADFEAAGGRADPEHLL
jgi:amidohydrolase